MKRHLLALKNTFIFFGILVISLSIAGCLGIGVCLLLDKTNHPFAYFISLCIGITFVFAYIGNLNAQK